MIFSRRGIIVSTLISPSFTLFNSVYIYIHHGLKDASRSWYNWRPNQRRAIQLEFPAHIIRTGSE
jgi:hypothetical protein